MRLTYVDADVLIAAGRGTEALSASAMSILSDPERSFVCSDYLRLEVMPNAVFFENSATTAFYQEFFDSAQYWIPSSPQLSRHALELACRFGLGAVDALHVAAAQAGEAELVTGEKSTKPMMRVTLLSITSIRNETGT